VDWINEHVNFFVASGALATTASIVWLSLQVLITQKRFTKQSQEKERDNDYQRKKCACDMARFFADEIVPLTTVVRSVVTASSSEAYKKLLDVFPSNKLKRFDKQELDLLLSASACDESFIRKTLLEIDPNILFSANLATCVSGTDRIAMCDFFSGIKDEKMKAAILIADYTTVHTNLLNKLEWFSMVFQYGIADEDVVYQSLHQMFLSTVNLVYYRIASINVYAPDKFYTNIIWLYNHWQDKLQSDQEEQLKREREAHAPLREVKPVQ